MRITAISDPMLVNSNYRAYQPLMALGRHGHEVHANRAGEPRFRAATLMQSDVVLIHRYFDRELQGLLKQLRTAGIGVVWDNDDDITSIPRSNPNYRRLGGANARRMEVELVKTFQSAHVVTTPSEMLAAKYRAHGAGDVRVLENYLPAGAFAKPRRHDGIVIVWLAGLEHQVDHQQLRLNETFERLLDARSDVRIVSIGLGLGLRSDRYEHMPIVEFGDLGRVLAAADIGIAPLTDIPWNQARSNIKLKEYAAAGLPWLASPVGAYVGMGEAEGGRLVADDGWHDALDELIAGERARKKLAKRAAKWAKGQSIDKHAGLWLTAFEDAIAQARSAAA